jgi:hypothetical protein
MAERYLIGSLQVARNARISLDEWEMQDLLSDLSRLANQFEKNHNYKESEYIAKWRMSVIGKNTQLASQPTAMDLLSNPTQSAADRTSSITPSNSVAGQPNYFGTQSGGGGYSPAGGPPGGIWHDPGRGGGRDHDHDHDGRCGRDREDLERAIEFLKKSMNQCAQGINQMNNLAR